MRRGVILLGAAVVVVGGLFVLTTGGGDGSSSPEARSGLETRTIAAGEVEVEIEPVRVDDEGAVFAVTMDTHSVELSADMELATLTVDGTEWPGATWSGDGPEGHHREGELTFVAAGTPSGTMVLTIRGLPEPVEAAWALPG